MNFAIFSQRFEQMQLDRSLNGHFHELDEYTTDRANVAEHVIY
jgi:hypothetical protein